LPKTPAEKLAESQGKTREKKKKRNAQLSSRKKKKNLHHKRVSQEMNRPGKNCQRKD